MCRQGDRDRFHAVHASHRRLGFGSCGLQGPRGFGVLGFNHEMHGTAFDAERAHEIPRHQVASPGHRHRFQQFDDVVVFDSQATSPFLMQCVDCALRLPEQAPNVHPRVVLSLRKPAHAAVMPLSHSRIAETFIVQVQHNNMFEDGNTWCVAGKW